MKIRLQKFMADCGVGSRRVCEEMILAGKVRVNDEVRTKLPVLIDPEADKITVDERLLAVLTPEPQVYYILNKPKGILVTTKDPAGRKTVYELMPKLPQRLFSVGRLDMDARGLILMTNDGELAHRLTHPRYGVEKTYIVQVDGRMASPAVESIKKGAWLGPADGANKPIRTGGLSVRVLARERRYTLLEVKLIEAKNQEVGRVLAKAGHKVRDILRVAIAEKITLKGLAPGQCRPLEAWEVQWLFKASSPEFHESKQAATQAWYEEKEMEKERKRLAKEGTTVEAPANEPINTAELWQPPVRKVKPGAMVRAVLRPKRGWHEPARGPRVPRPRPRYGQL